MFKDELLDRLAAKKDEAYRNLCKARERRKELGMICTRLHEELDFSYKRQNQLYEQSQLAWEQHRRAMQDCSDKIAVYRNESDRYHAEMTRAFDQASQAHDRRDGASAKSWSNEGHRCKEMMRSAKSQIAFLVSQSQDMKFRFENNGNKAEFDQVKHKTVGLKTEFADASSKLKLVKSEIEVLQTEFDELRKKFDERLSELKAEQEERTRRLARVAMFKSKSEREALEIYMRQQSGRDLQDGDKKSGNYVSVTCGWSRDRYMPVTDVIIRNKKHLGKHYHIVLGENGEELISEWRNES